MEMEIQEVGKGDAGAEVGEKDRAQQRIYPTLSANSLVRHNLRHSKPPESIVVRIEVTDTGYGIPPKEMVQSKLFSAFNQTEQGKQQGGKGTGLGLALVRQIVKRSGGRLGVSSKVGKGSTFWVELRGLVELVAKPGENPTVITRTINDALLHQPMPSSPEEDSPQLLPPVRPTNTPSPSRSRGPGTSTPGHIQLPPPTFTSQSQSSKSALLSPPVTRGVQSNSPVPRSMTPRPDGARSSPTPGPQESPTIPPGLHVLVVDDDPLTRLLMSRLLTRLGCVVSTAENGEIALEMIMGPLGTPGTEEPGPRIKFAEDERERASEVEEGRFAVVFLDNQMPVMSGLRAVAKLREAGRRDFVVGVTGNALLTDQEEYLEAGVDQILTKPVLERSLKAALVLAADRRRSSTGANAAAGGPT
ncbi:hypothetical protein EWM64_g9804 [Hericium alpestre]|uniref:histidine kinase n=1 Tax=Hericium alpestre TaxID=135208 RepID=A0A4Y9ZJ54_9AGAM|nr:hypothetical protein EWM64_g9804 [Hericium alpestre]